MNGYNLEASSLAFIEGIDEMQWRPESNPAQFYPVSEHPKLSRLCRLAFSRVVRKDHIQQVVDARKQFRTDGMFLADQYGVRFDQLVFAMATGKVIQTKEREVTDVDDTGKPVKKKVNGLDHLYKTWDGLL